MTTALGAPAYPRRRKSSRGRRRAIANRGSL